MRPWWLASKAGVCYRVPALAREEVERFLRWMGETPETFWIRVE